MRKLLLDANLLILLIACDLDLNLLNRHKRLSAFRVGDYQLLLSELGRSRGIVTMPNIATETINLLGQVDRPTAELLRLNGRKILDQFEEIYIPTSAACARPEYLALGLTDAAILHALTPDLCLLTIDLRLFLRAIELGHATKNFYHLRDT